MELEEMKSVWQKMSQQLEKQKLLTDKMIVEMTQQKYKNKLSAITIPESVGALVCFAMALYIILNFQKLDTWYLALSGLFSILFCIALPLLSLRSIHHIKNIPINSYKEAVISYVKQKNRFMKIQKLSYYVGFGFAIVILPVTGKLMSNKDIFTESNLWMFAIPFLVVFHIVFSKWVFKFYKKVGNDAGEILDDLNVS